MRNVLLSIVCLSVPFLLLACGDDLLAPISSSPERVEPRVDETPNFNQVEWPPLDDAAGVLTEVVISEGTLVIPELMALVSLEQSPAPAGVPIPYAVRVLAAGREVTTGWETAAEVEPSDGVTISDATITFSFPGEYVLEGTANNGADTLNASIGVTVVAGSPDTLTVTAVPEVARAGEVVTFDVAATDELGNGIDVNELDPFLWVEPIETSVDIAEPTITLFEPGRYEIHASWGELRAADVFNITASTPAFIDLVLEDYDDLDPGDTLDYEVYAEDQYGNSIERDAIPYDVFLVPSDGAIVESRRLRFETEGIFLVYASVRDSDIQDDEGPLVVDGFAPRIDIKAPDRGTYQTTATVDVYGTVTDEITGVDRVELNGVEVTLDEMGDFHVPLSAEPGINLIEVEAWDGEGHSSNVVQSFLYGEDFISSGEAVSNGLIARINQGTLDRMATWIAAEIDEDTIESMLLTSPEVWSGCVDYYFDEACASLDVTYFTITSFVFGLDLFSGYVEIDAHIYNPKIGLLFDNPISDISGYASSSGARLKARLYLSVVSGEVVVTVSNTVVTFDSTPSLHISLMWPFGDIFSALASFVLSFFEGDIEAALAAEIQGAAQTELQAALADLEISASIPLMGATISLDAVPQAISTASTGITLRLESTVEAGTVVPEIVEDALGSLRTPSSIPYYGSTPGFILTISDEFVNQALYSLWESGTILNLVEDQLGAGDIDMSMISALMPGATGVELVLDLMLPPVFRTKTSGTVGELQIGDMLVDLYATFGGGGSRQLMARIAVSAFADTDITLAEDNTLEFGLPDDPVYYLDTVFSALPNINTEDIDTLLGAWLPMMIPDLMGGVEQFPLPDFAGYTIGVTSVSVSGWEHDYINLAGNLVAQ